MGAWDGLRYFIVAHPEPFIQLSLRLGLGSDCFAYVLKLPKHRILYLLTEPKQF